MQQAGLTFPMSHLPRRLATLSLVFLILATLFSYGPRHPGHSITAGPAALDATLFVKSVAANGRAQLLTSREAGPYRIDVSSLPGQPVVNNTHLSILVWSLAQEQPITRAAVNVSATGPTGSSTLGPIPARNDVSPQYFETDLPFDMEGEWQVSIEVVAEPGEESIVVPVVVRRGGQINLFFLAAVVLAVTTLSVWTVRRVRRGRARANR